MKLHIVRVVLSAFMLAISFFAGQHFARPVAAQSHPKWEYRIIGSFHTVEQINKLGEEGWGKPSL